MFPACANEKSISFFDDVPPEIHRQVFSFLGLDDIRNIQSVDRGRSTDARKERDTNLRTFTRILDVLVNKNIREMTNIDWIHGNFVHCGIYVNGIPIVFFKTVDVDVRSCYLLWKVRPAYGDYTGSDRVRSPCDTESQRLDIVCEWCRTIPSIDLVEVVVIPTINFVRDRVLQLRVDAQRFPAWPWGTGEHGRRYYWRLRVHQSPHTALTSLEWHEQPAFDGDVVISEPLSTLIYCHL